MSMSANAHKPIIAILILLVASFSSAHAAPHSGASAVNLVAPPPPSPNSYPAALYTVGSQRKLLLIRQLFTPEHVLYTPFPLAPTRSLARSLSTVVWQVRGRPSGSRLDHGQTGRNQITSCLPTNHELGFFSSSHARLLVLICRLTPRGHVNRLRLGPELCRDPKGAKTASAPPGA